MAKMVFVQMENDAEVLYPVEINGHKNKYQHKQKKKIINSRKSKKTAEKKVLS